MPTPSFDRGHLPTEERNAASNDLDRMSTRDLLETINAADFAAPSAVRQAIGSIEKLVDAVVAGFESGGRLIYLGAGTSGRLGVLDASECPPTFFTDPSQVVGLIAGGDTALRTPVEGAEDDPEGAVPHLTHLALSRHDTVIGIAAGGTTPYIWGALRFAKTQGASVGAIICVPADSIRTTIDSYRPAPDSPDAFPDHIVELLVGPEIVTGSTRMKAGTATKLALNMITTGSMVRVGKTWGNLMVDLRATNAKLIDRAARILTRQTHLSREQALELLPRAQNSVKTALVMAIKEVDLPTARQLLAQSNGRLSPIIGRPRP